MNIFVRELKSNFKSLLIWSVIVFLFVVVGYSKFTAYEGNPEMLAVLDAMPPALVESFNMNTFNLTTITGFYGIMITYFGLMLSIASVMWGSDIITKEERDKTVEFSLTLPVRRATLVTAKALAVVINSLVLLLVTWGSVLLISTAHQTNSEYYRFVALSLPTLFMMQMIFAAVGIFLGCAIKLYKRANSTAVWILLATYFISILVGLNKDLEFLKHFTPFKYFDPVKLMNESRIEPWSVVLSVVIIAVLMVGGYLTYSKRDMYI